MKNNPNCFEHCPRLLDAAERTAGLGRTGVVQAGPVVRRPVEALIDTCQKVADADCDGPVRHEVSEGRTSLLGKLGLTRVDGSSVEYVCGITGKGRQAERYLFKDV